MNSFYSNASTNASKNYKQIGKPCMSYNKFKYISNPFNTKTVVVDDSYTSPNSKLVGKQNPKTLIPPMITTPCYSLDWRSSDMVVPNRINTRTNDDLYRSGYLSKEDKTPDVYTREKPLTVPSCSSTRCSTSMSPKVHKPEAINTIETVDSVENFTLPDYGTENWQNSIDVSNGYLPKQFETAKFPANLPQGKAVRQEDMADLNQQLFTQTVQPGLYYRENVIEPVNSNIGISFQQEFLPRSIHKTEYGEIVVDNDPNFVGLPTYTPTEQIEEPSTYNVYDPRFNGYGTSYRFYVDNVTGQPRFPYDDVNAVRMPNYITRNKIDTQNFSDAYGTMKDTGKSLNEIRGLANNAFYRDTEQHRNDIMVDISRKMNAAKWQQRQSPLGPARR
jgi:hypothetical protein